MTRKQIFIEQLNEGQRLDDVFLVKSARLAETRAGKPYLIIEVTDKSGEISGPLWDDAERYAEICKPGEFVHLRGIVQSYREKLQLRIESVEPSGKEEVHLADFIPASPCDLEEMTEQFRKITASVEDKWVRKLLSRFFDNPEIWDRFCCAPAAKAIHHAYVGGLMEHCLSMAHLADMVSSHYQGLNRSVLLAGVFFHDIGKLGELQEQLGVVEYTAPGRLKGHLVMGSEMVAREAAKIKDFPEDLLTHIQHLILSHHGRHEFGSPTIPMTPEAFLLNYIDEIDSKMNLIDQLRRKMKGSEPQWTEYQRTLERFLYLTPGGMAGNSEAAGGQSGVSEQHGHVQKTLF